jgi:hypothetical protein
LLGGERRGIAEGNNQIDLGRHQLLDQAREAIDMPLRPAALKNKVAILRIAKLCETADKRNPVWALVGHRRPGAERSDAIDLRRLLRMGGERPSRNRAAQKGYEFASLHSNISLG